MVNAYQEKLLDLLVFFHSFCIKNNLRYYAVGGTFLGAIRHKGFIPWDDDIDVCMPRKDYEKFIELMSNKLGKYVVETPHSQSDDYCYSVSKLYDTTTTVIENVKNKTKRGVFMDIFPLDGIGNTIEEIDKNYKKINWLNNLFATRTSVIRKERNIWKNVAILISGIIPESILNTKKLLKKLDELCAKYDFDDSKYVGLLLTQYGKKYIMERSIFEEISEYDFEGKKINGVKDFEKYLSQLYGNWNILPPENKRCSGHDFILVDLESSYLGDIK